MGNAPTESEVNPFAAVVFRPFESPYAQYAGLTEQLIELAAHINELRTQAHLIHLNYEGENFLGIHAFFKEQYEAHQEQFDAIGEFVRGMDCWMPMRSDELASKAKTFEHLKTSSGRSMLNVYHQNLQVLLDSIEQLEPVAAEFSALDVSNYLGELMAAITKSAWFLKASVRCN